MSTTSSGGAQTRTVCGDVELSVAGVRDALSSPRCRAVELTDEIVAHAEADGLNAFVTVAREQAREAARSFDDAPVDHGGALAGVPIAVKDNIATVDLRTTAGSAALGEWMADRDAAVVGALRSLGAIVIGKTNLDEFAYGPLGTGSAFGPVRNPVDERHVTGGSSAGSAAAVAAGLCVAAIGTDTAGSVRIPASFCGVVGLKPTLAALPCDGIVPLSRSQDHVGILAGSVEDASAVWDALRTMAPRRGGSAVPAGEQPAAPPEDGVLAGVSIGRAAYFETELADDVRAAYERALAELEAAGATVHELDLDLLEDALHVGSVLLAAEATTYHANALRRFGDDYGEEVRNRLLAGHAVAGVDYVRAVNARARLLREYLARTDAVDAIVGPTTAIVAPQLDEVMTNREVRERARRLAVRFTRPFNVLGTPALSLPYGRDRQGLPIGLQISARPHAEDVVLRVASTLERRR
jgi:aspartyl-tRNA(Asn)/glutamyl-tRNA(Gln) amidotransferase subunit A